MNIVKIISNWFKLWYSRIFWFCYEWLKMYSGLEPSFFSHKRVQAGIAFSVFTYGWLKVLAYLLAQANVPMSEYVMWAMPPLVVAGYTLQKIEEAKSKKNEDLPKE